MAVVASVIPTVAVAALVIGADTVGVLDAVDDRDEKEQDRPRQLHACHARERFEELVDRERWTRGRCTRARGGGTRIVDGVDQLHGIVPDHERVHDQVASTVHAYEHAARRADH